VWLVEAAALRVPCKPYVITLLATCGVLAEHLRQLQLPFSHMLDVQWTATWPTAC
jgi:hypothetical protein